MLEYLRVTYGTLHVTDITAMTREMESMFDPDKGMKKFIEEMEEAQQLAAEANMTIPNNMLAAIGTTAMYGVEGVKDELKKWEKQPDIWKASWDKWKQHFTSAWDEHTRVEHIMESRMGGKFANAVTATKSYAAAAQ